MKKLIAGVVLGVGLTAMAHGAGDPQAGEQNAAVCAGCHGQNGAKPIMGSYPKLSGLGEKYLYRQLVLIKDKERNIAEMTGILDNMNDQDLQDLAAYFNTKDMVVGQGADIDTGAGEYRDVVRVHAVMDPLAPPPRVADGDSRFQIDQT